MPQDSTLVNRKSNAAFARDASDWKWWNKSTPQKLAELVEDGYKIVIFT
jgi:bifunctional polynucleotide phosphatase/kinase